MVDRIEQIQTLSPAKNEFKMKGYTLKEDQHPRYEELRNPYSQPHDNRSSAERHSRSQRESGKSLRRSQSKDSRRASKQEYVPIRNHFANTSRDADSVKQRFKHHMKISKSKSRRGSKVGSETRSIEGKQRRHNTNIEEERNTFSTGQQQVTQFLFKKVKDPSFARPTVSSSKKNQSNRSSRVRLTIAEEVPNYADKSQLSEIETAIEDNTRNSKYRLFSLERKFKTQKHKSKEQIEGMMRKMNYLQEVNFEQQDKIKVLDDRKREANDTIDQMNSKLKMLNHRLNSQSDIQKHKDEKNTDKIIRLEKRIHQLTKELKEKSKKKSVELPHKKYERQRQI